MIDHEYNRDVHNALRAQLPVQPYVLIDPDANGALMIYAKPDRELPTSIYPMVLRGQALREAAELKIRLVVVESQFLKLDVAGSIRLARRAAFFPAALSGALMGRVAEPVHSMWVHPATWQTHMRGGRGKQPPRGEVKAEAVARTALKLGNRSQWVNAGEAHRSGIADTFQMGVWLREGFWCIH